MKKVILSLAVCASAAVAHAQSAGSILVYGNLGFNSSKDDQTQSFGGTSTTSTDKEHILGINPGIGYCLTNNLAVGIDVKFNSLKTEHPNGGTTTGTNKMNSIAVGPFVRYTKMLGEHFFTYAQLQVSYQHGEQQTGPNQTSTDYDYKGVVGNLYPAIGIRLTPCIAITGTIGGLSYDHKTYDYYIPSGISATNEQKSNNFSINLGNEFTLGVQINLGGHMHRTHHEPGEETRKVDTSDDDDMDTKKKKKSRKDDDE